MKEHFKDECPSIDEQLEDIENRPLVALTGHLRRFRYGDRHGGLLIVNLKFHKFLFHLHGGCVVSLNRICIGSPIRENVI